MSDIVRQTSLLSPAGARVVTDALNQTPVHRGTVAVPRRGASCYSEIAAQMGVTPGCCPPQGSELLRFYEGNLQVPEEKGCCPPQGREVLRW